MTLRARLETGGMALRQAGGAGGSGGTSETPPASFIDHNGYRSVKARIHQQLLEKADLQQMQTLSAEQVRDELKILVERLLEDDGVVINELERRSLVRDIQHEVLGLGPLEPLMADSAVTDILVNGHGKVYVERFGQLELTDVRFNDDEHLMKIVDKIVSGVGRRVDESSPMVDARLPDGSRVNVIIPPLALDGPTMSIRRFSRIPLTMDDFVRNKSLTPEMAQLLAGMAQAKLNVLISGGTGSGKTTLLNLLSGFIGTSERIVTIEDAAELQLQQPHVVRLESRPANIEGRGEISQRALVRNALRMRPDRIIMGEVRGAEAVDMLQAMNSGHEGSLATIHANTPRDALMRLENMLGLAGVNLPAKVARYQIASAIGVVIQTARLPDGKRKVLSIQEVTGMEGDVITMQEIFSFKQTGIDANGTVLGHFGATGVRARFADRLQANGIHLPDSLFDPARLHYVGR